MLLCRCDRERGNIRARVHMWNSENYSVESVLSFHLYVGSRDQIQVFMFVQLELLTVSGPRVWGQVLVLVHYHQYAVHPEKSSGWSQALYGEGNGV